MSNWFNEKILLGMNCREYISKHATLLNFMALIILCFPFMQWLTG